MKKVLSGWAMGNNSKVKLYTLSRTSNLVNKSEH